MVKAGIHQQAIPPAPQAQIEDTLKACRCFKSTPLLPDKLVGQHVATDSPLQVNHKKTHTGDTRIHWRIRWCTLEPNTGTSRDQLPDKLVGQIASTIICQKVFTCHGRPWET